MVFFCLLLSFMSPANSAVNFTEQSLCMMTNSFLATSKIYSLQIGLRRVSSKWGQMITTLSLWSFSWKLQHMSDSKNTLWMGHFEEIPNLSALSRRWRAVIFLQEPWLQVYWFCKVPCSWERGMGVCQVVMWQNLQFSLGGVAVLLNKHFLNCCKF